ncbi:uncharacterized oxidoreductase YjmC-like isoform X2 [Anneissia japonica]|uniref:uncharacterized oxidoreductase YjmC-like isoform X1 n=1 Tax=Anneissia japonica TaxID=1529436 RepID=UPI0014259799|nr:uncharacterized oxidoreductase YjmC-like isoform X1 [Anneissia japonica]XP_033117468.1 uncharacterized oxidoreductase YjmC-like isoform X2 [Anneissia japonica]
MRDYHIVAVEEARSFIHRCMVAAGTQDSHANDLAEVLVAADHRGHYSHGMNRLDMYVTDIKTGMTVCDKSPEILKETAATAWVEGNNLLGPVVGKFCTDIAIKKAKEAGIGWVVAKGSNHYGIAGWYALKAMQEGLIGMSFTNTSPVVTPTRAQKPAIGTNPIACGASAIGDDSFVLDMATSAVAFGKIELNDRKGLPIPDGWGSDSTGQVSNDAKAILNGGSLLPLGGTELCSGYKGYGLAMMVELFCGILGGASYGPNVRDWKDTGSVANLGQCFVAINPEAFAPGFPDRMQSFLNCYRNATPADSEKEVFVAGDPERKHIEKVAKDGGLSYHRNLVDHLNTLATDLKVEQIKTK